MAKKRRTKKQKQKAKHPFTVHWQPDFTQDKPEAKTRSSKAIVKGQTKNRKFTDKTTSSSLNKANYTEDYENLGSIKRNLVKSLVISSLIVSLEVVLYFIWQ